LPLASTIFTLLFPLGSHLSKRIDARLQMALGIFIGQSLVFASSFVNEYWGFFFLYGIGFGINNGIAYVIPISNCWKYYPNSKGLIGGIIVSGVGMGTFIFNLLSTYLVNPNSENADVNGLFDSDVANNVPYMIRILVACWASLGVVGITLIFPFKPET